MPTGRFGFAKGSSPLATRSVQLPKFCNARAVSKLPIPLTISGLAWPDWMRRSHASALVLKWPSAAGSVRVDLSPSW
jgi:hypothetical protein